MNDPGEPRLKAFRPPAPRAEREGGEREKKKRGGLEKQDGGGRGSCFLFFFLLTSPLSSLSGARMRRGRGEEKR
jgi:hypothetical protein